MLFAGFMTLRIVMGFGGIVIVIVNGLVDRLAEDRRWASAEAAGCRLPSSDQYSPQSQRHLCQHRQCHHSCIVTRLEAKMASTHVAYLSFQEQNQAWHSPNEAAEHAYSAVSNAIP